MITFRVPSYMVIDWVKLLSEAQIGEGLRVL